MTIPEGYEADVHKAVSFLKALGCSEVYLFGSVAGGSPRPESDLDFAVRGCPPDRFYYAAGRLLTDLDHQADLIDLDRDLDFGGFLQRNGDLIRVA